MIHEEVIQFKKGEIKVRFGMWTISELIKRGYSLSTLQQDIERNPIEFLITITYLGACNASSKDLEAYSINDFYDWADELEGGLNSNELSKIQKCFTNSLTYGVSTEENKTKKKK